MSKGTGKRFCCAAHDACGCKRCRVADAKPSDRKRLQAEPKCSYVGRCNSGRCPLHRSNSTHASNAYADPAPHEA